MSDVDAWNLWKIRHFQDNMKNLRSLTGVLLLLAVCTAGAGAWLYRHPEDLPRWRQTLEGLLPGVFAKSLQPEAEQENTTDILAAIAEGNRILREARLRLSHTGSSLSANLLQMIQTPEQTYRGTGRFVQSTQGKSLFEVRMEMNGLVGSMTQVSNGQVIWLIQELQASPASENSSPEGFSREQVIDRVDLQRVQGYALDFKVSPQDPRIAKETLGGIAGLLASLEHRMDFQLLKKVRLQDEPLLVLQGEWKISPNARSYSDSFVAQVAQAGVPDRVRLYLRERDLLPIRYICLKRHPRANSWYAPLAIELTDIVQDAIVDSSLFNYRPPADQVPNDITHQYLHRLESLLNPQFATTQPPDYR